nr:hypothetical protein [Flavobacterium sp. ASV13]
MRSENYLYTPEESVDDLTSYEEQLSLNYDDYLDGSFQAALKASRHYDLELGGLEDDLEDDFESEYDENDWEEESSHKDYAGEYDKNEEQPGAFIILD